MNSQGQRERREGFGVEPSVAPSYLGTLHPFREQPARLWEVFYLKNKMYFIAALSWTARTC